ncbi:MAG: metallophosphoesterase family protein [Pikeienuella sp.]|uniref:metallophosphoesterase family protein n=1 Tax=Pikeienuella sp. TaxID=2831957 RepID=UPI00391B1413
MVKSLKRFLIVSDIHAISEELSKLNGYHGDDGSSFKVESRTPVSNPVLAIAECLKSKELSIDALICLGDFAHQAKKLVMLQVWHDLHEVAEALKIPNVIGVTGNHDIATRVDDMEEAAGRVEFLKQVKPKFPSADDDFCNGYHQHGVGALEIGECLVVAIDTCMLHGMGKDSATSSSIWSVGYLTDGMIDRIMTAIDNSSCSHVLIAMHHHPVKVDGVLDSNYDEVPKGPRLLELLAGSSKTCFVVHGHKHLVKLKRQNADTKYPALLSAASLAAYPYLGQGSHYSNQFHLIEYDTSTTERAQGAVFSWDWSAARWEPSKKHSMPHVLKFGPVPELAKIEQAIKDLKVVASINRDKLFEAIPEIEYLTPDEIDTLNSRLDGIGLEVVTKQSRISGVIVQGGGG